MVLYCCECNCNVVIAWSIMAIVQKVDNPACGINKGSMFLWPCSFQIPFLCDQTKLDGPVLFKYLTCSPHQNHCCFSFALKSLYFVYSITRPPSIIKNVDWFVLFCFETVDICYMKMMCIIPWDILNFLMPATVHWLFICNIWHGKNWNLIVRCLLAKTCFLFLLLFCAYIG